MMNSHTENRGKPMHVDLTDGPNEVTVEALHGGVWIMIGGFPVYVCWDQWFNLLKASEDFERKRNTRPPVHPSREDARGGF
jgi:hypothetical protein